MSNIYSARFIDSERQNIEVLRETDVEGVYEPHTFPLSDTKQLEALFKEADIDMEWLHESTTNWIKSELNAFEKTVINIAVEQDMLTGSSSSKISSKALIERILDLLADQKSEEYLAFLFDLKMSIFEMEAVKTSKNTRAKGTLRKTKSLVEVLTILEKLSDA